MIEGFILSTLKSIDGVYVELFDLAAWCTDRGVPQADFFRAIVSLRGSGRILVRIHEGKTYYCKSHEQTSGSLQELETSRAS